jgi:hypothetical protein
MKIEIADLGAWHGGARLLAEYDPEDDAIRVDAAAVERIRAALGEAEAERFVRCAVAHERAHRAHPGIGEEAAHARARATCGVDPRAFEPYLR